MKYSALVLLLCALLPLSNAYCYVKPVKYDPDQPLRTHCQDDVDKTWHPIGSKWRNSECMDCTCDSCCSGFSIPRSFPDDCVSVFKPEECVYVVHKRDDPSVECPIYGAVGK
ncbi:beta-microseminoprotein A1-like [Cololabis saira]|uniref:beta-microseminoprotein A1-like n=1 Tax=Cololabis saira TaxID=129043 RepID=UPI002AD31D8B|nr:beta-microseminoprotein A1-like [Cololabis saira]